MLSVIAAFSANLHEYHSPTFLTQPR